MSKNNINESAEVVFEYTGEGCAVPKDVTIVLFHPSVVEVEYVVFKECRELREVIFNDGLKKIGKLAFWDCKSLSSITLPPTVTEIEREAFRNCSNLREVVFHEGLQTIGQCAFLDCTSLSRITLPSTVTEIGNYDAFADCITIGSYVFCGCSNLREVVFHEGLQKIGVSAFLSCRSLQASHFHQLLLKLIMLHLRVAAV